MVIVSPLTGLVPYGLLMDLNGESMEVLQSPLKRPNIPSTSPYAPSRSGRIRTLQVLQGSTSPLGNITHLAGVDFHDTNHQPVPNQPMQVF